MQYLFGNPIKTEIKAKLKEIIDAAIESGAVLPHLAIIQVGDNERSAVYIRQKEKFAHTIGAEVTVHTFPADIAVNELVRSLDALAKDNGVHGIIIQMPLPTLFTKDDLERVISTIPHAKDADGLTSINAGYLFQGSTNAIVPATTRGVLNMLAHYNIEVDGKNIVVVGRSNLVGKPTAIALLSKGATVTICHSKTKDLDNYIRQADIVALATGIPGIAGKHNLREGQVVIDIGISLKPTGGICGDVNHEGVDTILGQSGSISPVPGGVGPLTVAGLFQNLIDLYMKQVSIQ